MTRFSFSTLAIATLLLHAPAFAQAPATPPPPKAVPAPAPQGGAQQPTRGPKFVCTNSPFNFGVVWAGARINHKFLVRNDGDAPLQILQAKPACSCTLVGDYPRIIQPGQTVEFPAVLDTRHKHDQIDVALDVTTNEKFPMHKLEMTGYVKNALRIEPVGSNWFYGVKDGPETHAITLKNGTASPIKVELIPMPPNSGFVVMLTETKPGQEFVANVTAKGPFKEGSTQEFAQIRTSIPEVPVYKLELNAYLPPRINVSPPWMGVDGNQREPQKRPLVIMNNGKTPLNIHDITVSNGLFNPRLVKRDTGLAERYEFEITIPPYYRPTHDGETIMLNTDDPEMKQIFIRVIASGNAPPLDLVPPEFRENAAGRKTPTVTVKAVVTSAPAS